MSSIEKEKIAVKQDSKSGRSSWTLILGALGIILLGWKSKILFKKSSGSVARASNFNGQKEV